MRRNLWASIAAMLAGLPATAGAVEPKPGILERGRDVVQTCWHKCCALGKHHSEPALPGDDAIVIGQLICQLESAPKPCDRRRAANQLEKFDWRYHPEIVTALIGAMQSDPAPIVRWDAADALKGMRACDPETLAALDFSRQADPCCRVRYKAKWGLIEAEKSRPPVLSYVSGYAKTQQAGLQNAPELEPIPAPDLRQTTPPEDRAANPPTASSVRSRLATVAARVRPRH